MPTAFITGITGQDGSYLSDFLLAKGYKVIGLVSTTHNIGYQNIAHLKGKITLTKGDLLDMESLKSAFSSFHPDEVYNLGGLTFIPPSWKDPTLTLDVNTQGVSRLLTIINTLYPKTRFYQASSSKIFGNPSSSPQNETTPIVPADPYSVSKAAAHQLVSVFRSHFHIFACSGILYNHESERRGEEFVTRKVTSTAAKIKLGMTSELVLGDLSARQDWGYAPDYVEAMWMMLQLDQPHDFVIASGKSHSVRELCEIAFNHLNLDYKKYVKSDRQFQRIEQSFSPEGDITKAIKLLSWRPKVSFEQMIIKMVENDLKLYSSQKGTT